MSASAVKRRIRPHHLFSGAALILVGLLMCLVSLGCGSPQWQALESGTSHDLFGVSFADATHGWAVGTGGTILATSDSGEHWEAQRSGTRRWLWDVDFPDARHGWTVGDHGMILATSDGGSTWHRQRSGVRARLLGVSFVNARCGWVCGHNSILLATTDGGETWQEQKPPTKTDVLDVVFVTQDDGWALSANIGPADSDFSYIVLRTTDGGLNWDSTVVDFRLSLDLCFIDQRHGWAAGQGIYRTTDGGIRWLLDDAPNGDGVAVAFADDRRGWLVGGAGSFSVSEDGGKTWESKGIGSWDDLHAVACLDAQRACAVGDEGLIVELFTARE